MANKLKSCPFCGDHTPRNEDGAMGHYAIVCGKGEECGAELETPDDNEAIAAWNTRAPIEAAEKMKALVEAGEALVAKLDECEPHIASVFAQEYVRGRPYSGPQYKNALDELRTALRNISGGDK